MYKKFFNLKENPFNVNPDPRYLFLTRSTQEALACLTYGIETRKGFILLTGEVGTGKTTLLNKLLGWLHQENVASLTVLGEKSGNPRGVAIGRDIDLDHDLLGRSIGVVDPKRIPIAGNGRLLRRLREGAPK